MKNLFLILIIISINKYVYSNNLFNSSFYDIEFTSKNIEDDKIESINQIKNKSFKSILKKTLQHEDYISLSYTLSEDLINTFIKNIIIDDEKIINDTYLSKIKINFDKKKIVNYFRLKKIPYIEYYPDKFLLIIYETGKMKDNLFTKNNIYYKYYLNNFQENNFFKIPNLDINDRYILKKNHILNRDTKKLNNFLKKYDSEEYLIVIAKTNNNQVNYDLILYSQGNYSEKKIKYNKNEIDIFLKNLENESLELWKNLNHIQNVSLNYISCKVIYFNLLELKEIRNNLSNISIIDKLDIKTLSFQNIKYDISYYGNLNILLKILQLNKLKITFNESKCVIRLK